MIVIRPVTQLDLPQLTALVQRGAAWRRYAAMKLWRRDAKILMAKQDDQVVGFIFAQIVERGQPAAGGRIKNMLRRLRGSTALSPDSIIQPIRIGSIEKIYVAPALRRQGVATALIQRCNQWLQHQQIAEIQTAIEPTHDIAQGFLHQLGFEPSRVLMLKHLDPREQVLKKNIRSATRHDLPQLAELVCQEVEYQEKLAQCFQLVPQVDWVQYVSAKLQDDFTKVLVIEQGRRLTGFIEVRIVQAGQHKVLAPFRQQSRDVYGFIEDIFVVPVMRRQGIALALVEHSLHWLQDQQISQVRVGIWQANQTSLNFFHKLNFEPIKQMMSKKLLAFDFPVKTNSETNI